MSKYLSQLVTPTPLLYIFLSLAQVATGIYTVSKHEPPLLFQLTYTYGLLWVIGWWLVRDSGKRGVGLVFDMGLFLYIAWPLVMPYYLLKTRGAKGLLVILGFLGVYMGGAVVGATICAVLILRTG
jgi:hypothetical protein